MDGSGRVYSDDLLVSEEVLQVGDLQICRHCHDHDGDGAKDHYSALDLCIFVLQVLFAHDQVRHLCSELFDHVLNLLCLQLDGFQMLLRNDVGVVGSLHASRHAKGKGDLFG